MDWIGTNYALPQVGKVVDTKISDEKGERNQCKLMLCGKLWFEPDGSMYVYYNPTHWREIK